MDEKPEMFKSRCIDCVYYARTWNSFEFGKCCDKLEEQALVLMVDNGLSNRQYQRILEHAENLNCKLYLSYHKVKEAKQIFCPHSISMTETSAEIILQTLVDHTVSRICHIEFVTEKLRLSTKIAFEIIMKWGCDVSEQNRYKQKFSEENFSDKSLFSICVVPLQIHSCKDDSKSVIWKIPFPFKLSTVDLLNLFLPKNQQI
ncbi:hypothetical protein AVEN_238459-1 [Araneus ventricosus]|uniref:Uncharacterized protein n=1 Tax=Araneus ventricosus TaxID=182803 RepID=A0A4Y2LCF7_ARAVE|nr:hypothetical protein AVEN_238459-1 [Araneus ventricosus]